MSAFDPNDKNIKINWRDEPDEENKIEPILTPREILSNVAEESLKSRTERKAVKEYKEIIKQFNSYTDMKKYLISRTPLNIEALNNLEINILKLNKTLSALEKTDILMEIYKRVANIPKVYNSFSVEEYLQKELEKRKHKNLLNFAWPFIVLALIIGLMGISVNLVGALLLAIPIVPLGFIILFFLLQWIIGKEKMNRYGTFITIALLVILAITCIILSAVVF